MYVSLGLISGFMVGLEVVWDSGYTIFDLGIVRIIIGKFEDDE